MKSICSKLSRVAWTVRYLKARQIAGQVRHRLFHSLERYGTSNGDTGGSHPGCAWPRDVRFLPPIIQDNAADIVREGSLRFLNSEVKVGFPPQWACPEWPKLWQYNLYYFEWLWDISYQDAKAVVLGWMANHRVQRDAIGWDSYSTSLRLMNWCAVFFGKCSKQLRKDTAFLGKLWSSIFLQAQWLAKHLEWHLLGSHLFENAAALALVGSCFNGVASNRWFRIGMSILAKEIPEQILPDGMHFELTPMYHSRILYLITILMATGNSRIRQLLTKPLVRMARALKCVCHPDGQIALLNDSAFGIYNRPEQLIDYCNKQMDEAVLDFTDGCGPDAALRHDPRTLPFEGGRNEILVEEIHGTLLAK